MTRLRTWQHGGHPCCSSKSRALSVESPSHTEGFKGSDSAAGYVRVPSPLLREGMEEKWVGL